MWPFSKEKPAEPFHKFTIWKRTYGDGQVKYAVNERVLVCDRMPGDNEEMYSIKLLQLLDTEQEARSWLGALIKQRESEEIVHSECIHIE